MADLRKPSGVTFAVQIMLEAVKLPNNRCESMYPRMEGMLNRRPGREHWERHKGWRVHALCRRGC